MMNKINLFNETNISNLDLYNITLYIKLLVTVVDTKFKN